jgi:ribosomal protein L35
MRTFITGKLNLIPIQSMVSGRTLINSRVLSINNNTTKIYRELHGMTTFFTSNTNTGSILFIKKSSITTPITTTTILKREFKTKSHSGVKKRFRARASGAVYCKPAGNRHGMHKHRPARNRRKHSATVFAPGETAKIQERVAEFGGLKRAWRYRRTPSTSLASKYRRINNRMPHQVVIEATQ